MKKNVLFFLALGVVLTAGSVICINHPKIRQMQRMMEQWTETQDSIWKQHHGGTLEHDLFYFYNHAGYETD